MKTLKHFCLLGVLSSLGFAADLDRGRQLYLEGNLSEAVTELRQVVQQSPDDPEANRLLGLALVENDKVSEGERYIKRAVELDPGPAGKIAAARLLVAQKQYDRAEEMLHDAAGDDLEYVRGLVHLNRERYEEAAKDFESYLQKHGERAYAHYYAGLAYNKLRQPDKMLTHFEQFVRMRPDAPEARKVRAVLQTGR